LLKKGDLGFNCGHQRDHVGERRNRSRRSHRPLFSSWGVSKAPSQMNGYRGGAGRNRDRAAINGVRFSQSPESRSMNLTACLVIK
jgi:hypothetical protein